MRKYAVPLALATSGDTRSIAYARMLFDLLHSSELNEPLQYEGSFNDLKDEQLDKLLELLGVSLDERADHLTNPDQLTNYDVAIALASAGNIEYARKVLQGVDVKKTLSREILDILICEAERHPSLRPDALPRPRGLRIHLPARRTPPP